MLLLEKSWARQPGAPTGYSQKAVKKYSIVGGFVVDTGYEPKLVNNRVFTNVNTQGAFAPSPASFGLATRVVDTGSTRYYSFPQNGVHSQNFTFLARIRINDAGASGVVSASIPYGTNTHIFIWRNGGQFDFRINGTNYTQAGTFSLNTWYDIEIVGTPSGCTYYVNDAVLISGAAAASGEISNDFHIMDCANTTGWNEYGYWLLCSRALRDVERVALKRNPWQLFEPRRIWVPVSTGGTNTYTFSVSGGATFSGTSPLVRERIQTPSGGIVFAGAPVISHERAIAASGQVTFSGSAPIVSTASYQFDVSGGVTFSGAPDVIKEKTLPADGGVNFGGSARLIFVPVGGTGTNDSDRISVGVSRKVGVS